MRRVLLTFSGAKYFDTTKRIVEDAPRFGADEVMVADDWWLKNCHPGYWRKMEWFRQQRNKREGGPRGVDWFCFKSFTILNAFRRLNRGDVLLYTDADTVPIADLTMLYERCVTDGGAMLFSARGCTNAHWTKRDCFILMGCDEPRYYTPWQTVARFMLFEKGGAFPVEDFLGQWLGFTANPILNTFERSILGLPELTGFREHRCEQSVLTCLSLRYGLRRYREACEFGGWDGPSLPEEADDGYPGYQTFSQVGKHSFRPGYSGDESEGSSFRNLND